MRKGKIFTKWQHANQSGPKLQSTKVAQNCSRRSQTLNFETTRCSVLKMRCSSKSSKGKATFLLLIQRRYWTPATERQAVTSYNFHHRVQ